MGSLLQGIFPTQGLNPGVPHCRWILYHLSHQRSPGILEYPGRLEPIPSPGDCPNPGSKRSLLHCWWILYRLSYPGAHQGEKHVSNSVSAHFAESSLGSNSAVVIKIQSFLDCIPILALRENDNSYWVGEKVHSDFSCKLCGKI